MTINHNYNTGTHTRYIHVHSHDGNDGPDSIPQLSLTGGWLNQFGFEIGQRLKMTLCEGKMVLEVETKKDDSASLL
ncbi:hypothetical protein VA7868_02951 [Vibrio aerogenes CECT 7868]|jgi:hypothetical protein|uniref:Toxin SymE-like domain-containing protein n=1 Tax=Vibrio aerogenes CECT 7868 TaxID=1216006 RepID=A0A1M5ZN36_9VIBR|nr:SymE family type I addiction module toxin [Vibrio aerogenes]SHI25578.1 hypothetical protein VA7868_02951 [Vibrio aerogenes CECT 7868]